MVVAGGFIALQSPINSGLGRHVGALQGAFVSFLIGTLVLLVCATFARGGLGRISDVGNVSSWIYVTGGVLGAGYVTAALLSVRPLGTGGVIAATIAGELAVGVLIDQFGWFGVDKHAIDPARVAGIVLLAVGVLLIVKR
jgi:bacterial/archaeal transporter family-2 protein